MYEKEKINLSKVECNNYCNRVLKSKYIWLKEVDKFAITNSIYNLDNACNRYMSNLGGKPKLKKRMRCNLIKLITLIII